MTATYQERIRSKLTTALSPARLDIVDESHRHAGHADRIAALKDAGGGHGHAPVDGGGETHFAVAVVSAAFDGKSRLDRQRMVNDLLKDELRERVHALALRCQTPAEAGL